MAVRTWVGRFCVSDGHVEEEGRWLGSLIRQRPDEEADELYVLVEPASPESEEFTSQLVDVVAQLYARDPLSLTGALSRSLRAAHEHLREWNRTSLREHRVGAGATCLALRGADAYLAQAGPSLAYVLDASGGFRRIEAQEEARQPLGSDESFEPWLTRVALGPGDLVLLASTNLDDVAPPHHIRRILERGSDDALPELYLLCRDQRNLALVMLSCFEETESPPSFLTRSGEPDADMDAATAAAADEAGLVAVGVGQPAAHAEAAVPPLASASAAEFAMGGFDPPQRPIHEQVREITASTAPAPATGVRLRGDGATPRYKRTTGAPLPQFQVPKLAVFAVIALVIVGLVAWWQLPGSVQESREDKFTTLIAEAREANARAQATSDTGLKRQLLTGAQSKLADAKKIHDDNNELLVLQSDVAAALGVLDAVYEVRDFTQIIDVAQQVTGALSIAQSVTGGGSAYFLDAKGRRVLRVPLDGSSAPETVLQEGELAGFVTAGRPVQIAWSEQTQALVMIDESRQAFGYFPDRGALPLAVRAAESWGSLNAITASGGNLYVLDVKENQVWRYLPGQGGYDSERTALLDGANLENATELAVGQDVYVLDNQAGIRRFAGKTETPFPLAGIDRPLMQPASLSVLPGSNRLVVADRGNKRIVVASADGAFLRQIVSPSFTDLRAVAVDEGTSTLFVLNGDTLLKAPFPP